MESVDFFKGNGTAWKNISSQTHKVITNHQNSIARQMKIGEIQVVQWPMPNGNIYPAQH